MKLFPQRRQVNEFMFKALLPGRSVNSQQGRLEGPLRNRSISPS